MIATRRRVAGAGVSTFSIRSLPHSLRRTACLLEVAWRTRRGADVAEAASEDIVIMKTTLAILVLCSLALMTSGADAQKRSHYSRGETLQHQPSGGLYDSLSQGHQSYPNYDRETYVNRSYGSWKTLHKAQSKPIKH
jgi:hypothetical protein